ncbi:MAG: cupin domain-containing protein [Pseudomonadota bacterium]
MQRSTVFFVSAFLLCSVSSAMGNAVVVTQETLKLTVERVVSPARPGELAELLVEAKYRSGMRQKDYPDFIALEQDLRSWLGSTSPDHADDPAPTPSPWPQLLSDLARRALEDYKAFKQLSLTVIPQPSAAHLWQNRFSVIAQRNGGPSKLVMHVPLLRQGLEYQGPNVIDLTTVAHFDEGTAPDAVPGADALREQVIELLTSYPTKTDYWETLIKAIGTTLLEQHKALSELELLLTVYPTATLTMPHNVYAHLEREGGPALDSSANNERSTHTQRSARAPEIISLDDQPWYEAEDRAVARELISPRNSSTETLSIAEIVVPPGVTVRPHQHHMEEIYHVLDGQGVVMVEDQSQTIKRGDTVLIPANSWHNIVNEGDVDLRLHVTCVPAWAPEHLVFERGVPLP